MSYDFEEFSKRVSQLRLEKGVSAREMSLSLGQNESYINRIENGKSMPSLAQFFNLCDYLNITPQEFFDEDKQNFQNVSALYREVEKLTPDIAKNLLEILKKLNEKKK